MARDSRRRKKRKKGENHVLGVFSKRGLPPFYSSQKFLCGDIQPYQLARQEAVHHHLSQLSTYT